MDAIKEQCLQLIQSMLIKKRVPNRKTLKAVSQLFDIVLNIELLKLHQAEQNRFYARGDSRQSGSNSDSETLSATLREILEGQTQDKDLQQRPCPTSLEQMKDEEPRRE